ncbi:alpha/beta hydrolase [Bordetella genomosp. 9]|uniref:alpha/beta fold hydrolase n=1 Tax=Bordetella genomosp. 9 TaxID=1416803 RepID=UPI000A292706|nr:alpha/beta hydrolase [Bordetella genomosp. 9]ARP90127.1 alpha/beta hydrolase [Bordetella genomosp. 9]
MTDIARPPVDGASVPVQADGQEFRLEYQWIARERADAPLLVFLHEGLGSLSMWKDWPARVCEAAGCRGLLYSRPGYGRSTPRPAGEKWPVGFMHTQAHAVLPALFQALHLDARRDRPILFGHSDGGSIALLYAARYPDAVAGVIAAAPHVFVEDITVRNIQAARRAYLDTDLRDKLGRYHDDPDSAFWGWNDIWLDPAFRGWNIEAVLADIVCPVLALQGEDDEYGTLAQVESIARRAPHASMRVLPDCGHSPHRDQPQAVIDAIKEFLRMIRP